MSSRVGRHLCVSVTHNGKYLCSHFHHLSQFIWGYPQGLTCDLVLEDEVTRVSMQEFIVLVYLIWYQTRQNHEKSYL